MSYIPGIEANLNPPDRPEWAECYICLNIVDLGDMKQVDEFNEIYVCNTCVKENSEEYQKLEKEFKDD